jgi:hypothetical protein
MQSPELLLRSEASEYVQGRIAFTKLYTLAGNLLPRLMDIELGRALAGAILIADVECREDPERRVAVAEALDRYVAAEV